MNRRALFVSMAAAGWLFFGVRFSLAATFNIPNGNVAALIAAINTANNNDDFDTINLATNGLYTLTAINNATNGNNGLPLVQNDVSFGGTEIGTDLTINGNGARLERGEFAPEFRILQVVGGATCVINNLNMNRGRAIALTGSQGGGAIFNNASRVILGGCSFDNNATRGMDGADVSETRHGIEGRGGALCSSSAIVMQASACTFSNNKAQGGNGGRPNFGEGGRGGQAQGGAIYSSNDVLLLSNCTFIGNFGSGGVGPAGEGTMGGGAIFAAGGLLSGCTFASNSAYSGGALLITGNVTLDGCTLSSNFATSRGGAVYNYGTALVNNCSITNGLAVFGGGIFNNGVLTITNSRFSGNFTNVNSAVSFDTGGGAIYYSPLFADEDSLTIRNTIFENNEARKGNDRLADGGAIYNFMQLAHSGKVIVDRCTFRGNRAELGSGIYQKIETGPSDLIVTDSTFVGNRADGSGAGICQFVSYKFGAATLTAINSTFSDNFAGQAGSGIYNGAVNDAASGAANATIVSCTFSGNSASSGGGAALANYNSAAAMKLSNTILKTGAIGTNLANGGGTFTSQGNNLSNDAAGGDGATGPGGFLDAPEDIRNTDPKLDTLQKNGGSTETQALLPGSPAIDAGNDSKAPPQDQRGFPRFGRSDIGAFEVQSTSTPTPTPNPTITPTATPSPTPTPIATPTPTATATPAPTATPTPTATPVPTPEPSPTPQPPAPVITSPLSVTAVVGQPFTYQIIASNSPTSYGASNLPNGLALDGGLGIISGTPATIGQNQAGLTATNASGAGFASLTLKVEAAPAASGPVITNALSVTARTDQPFSFQVFASGMTSNMRVVANALPPGIIFDSSTNRFSGTPAANGSYAVQLLITSRPPLDDQIFYSTTLQITFVSDTAVPVITSPSSITLTPGQPFNYTIASPNSASDPTIFSLIGTLPEGLSFDPATGQISGTYQGSARRRSQPAGSPPNPAVASEDSGSAVMTVMLVARNSRGIATAPLTFLLPQPVRFANISTRLRVETGDNVLIGGFIVTGTQPKKIIVRGIGTSLPFLDRLENPTLELHGPSGLIEANDNWVESPNRQAIIDSTIPPGSGFESAIVATVPANDSAYTAIVRGVDGGTGIGVVEAYDLDGTVDSKLANISTRGLVQTGDNVLIAGTIVVGPTAQRVIVRAIGPSLSVLGKLEDPVLELRDGNGELVAANDNWRSTQEAEIIATTIPPANDFESAIVTILPGGNASYTAIVRGVGDTTGIAVVEVYALQ